MKKLDFKLLTPNSFHLLSPTSLLPDKKASAVPVVEEDKKILFGSNEGKNGKLDLCRNFRGFDFCWLKNLMPFDIRK